MIYGFPGPPGTGRSNSGRGAAPGPEPSRAFRAPAAMPCRIVASIVANDHVLDNSLGESRMLASTSVDCFATRVRGCSPRSCNTRTYHHAPAIAPWSFSRAGRGSRRSMPAARVAEHRRGQHARLVAQRREIVDRVEDQRLLLVTACVRRDGPPFRNEHSAIDVALDGHHPVGEGPRDAVAIAVEGNGLVLVHSNRGIDRAGVERMLGPGRRRGEVLGQTGLDQELTEERESTHARPRSAPGKTGSTRSDQPRGARGWRSGAARP